MDRESLQMPLKLTLYLQVNHGAIAWPLTLSWNCLLFCLYFFFLDDTCFCSPIHTHEEMYFEVLRKYVSHWGESNAVGHTRTCLSLFHAVLPMVVLIPCPRPCWVLKGSQWWWGQSFLPPNVAAPYCCGDFSFDMFGKPFRQASIVIENG